MLGQNGVWPFLLSCAAITPLCPHEEGWSIPKSLCCWPCVPRCCCSRLCLGMEVPHGRTSSCRCREAAKHCLCTPGKEINPRQKLVCREPTSVCLGQSRSSAAQGSALPRMCLCCPCKREGFLLRCHLRAGMGPPNPSWPQKEGQLTFRKCEISEHLWQELLFAPSPLRNPSGLSGERQCPGLLHGRNLHPLGVSLCWIPFALSCQWRQHRHQP